MVHTLYTVIAVLAAAHGQLLELAVQDKTHSLDAALGMVCEQVAGQEVEPRSEYQCAMQEGLIYAVLLIHW